MHYQNPILNGDYADPDVIRVGKDYYMVSSSFTYLPGIPLLHSVDLIHWALVNYVVRRLPFPRYDRPAHACGTWAPSIRYHNGMFYVYVCLPDEGLLAYTAADPRGEWTAHYVKDVCGWIDPCPLFDENGQAYLVHAFAGSRAGIKNTLFLHRMSPDGLQVLDEGRVIFEGILHGDITAEGPKMYKRNGLYYVFCPAGGVKTGYQLALRAASPYGPYARRVVLSQGDTPINGPHQGAWVDTEYGEDFFIHFQDQEAYGRVPHLQPMRWVDDWPEMGENGQPVLASPVPKTGHAGQTSLQMSDDFNGTLGMQWQWQANPLRAWYDPLPDGLRLYAAPADSLFEAGQFLSQLMQHKHFDMHVRVTLHDASDGCAGIGMMGYDYHYLVIERGQIALYTGHAQVVSRRDPERVDECRIESFPWDGDSADLRMSIRDGHVQYAFGTDGAPPAPIGPPLPMRCGGWTSARPGIFCMSRNGVWGGYAHFHCCKVTNAPNR